MMTMGKPLLWLPLAFAIPTAVAAQVASTRAVVAPTVAPERIEGVLADGTRWLAQKPANWNGTLLLDLDGAGPPLARPPARDLGVPSIPGTPPPAAGAARYNAFNAWLLEQGFALGGITREPVGYDFPKAVNYLLDVRQRFAARWIAPKRTLAVGGSRGAFVVRKSLELHPEVFDGGMLTSGGGAGEIAVLNSKLNAVFVLKTLVDPAAPLTLVNVDAPREIAAFTALVAKARATPEGRARLALAAAVEQFARWSKPGSPKPAAGDYGNQLDQIADSFVFGNPVPVRAGVEKIAGGNVSWNTGVDYAALLRRSGRMPMVEALYRDAGLSLAGDLATLAKTPRISADPAAVRRAEPLMTYTGQIKGPLVDVDNDDPVDPASDKVAYLQTLRRAGTADRFRLIWADGPGHGGQTALDKAVGFTLLISRLDSGRWSDTSLPTLRAMAMRIGRASAVDLGASTLFDPGPIPAPVQVWGVQNWGTYRAPVR